MQGWVDLVGLLHTEMVYPPEDRHPSSTICYRRALTSFMRRTLLTTTPRHQPVVKIVWTVRRNASPADDMIFAVLPLCFNPVGGLLTQQTVLRAPKQQQSSDADQGNHPLPTGLILCWSSGCSRDSNCALHSPGMVFGHVARLDDVTLANMALQSAPHQRITQPTSWPHVASPTWSSTEQVARPAAKRFHTSDWRPLETCYRLWTWWCNDATALAGYAKLMMMIMTALTFNIMNNVSMCSDVSASVGRGCQSVHCTLHVVFRPSRSTLHNITVH